MVFWEIVKEKHPYLSEDDAQKIANKAQAFYFYLRYPNDNTKDPFDTPIEGFMAEQWVLAACDEIIEREGISSSVAYKENGISMDFKTSQLSPTLINLVKPVVGVIKK